MASSEDLLRTLDDSKAHGDEGLIVTKLLLDATQQDNPIYDLVQLQQAIHASSTAQEIDALTVVPYLLVCSKEGAVEMLGLIGDYSSPKESVIALQEASERLNNHLEADDPDAEDELDDGQEGGNDSVVPISSQVIRVLDLYASVLPRLLKRRKPPSDILRPLITQVESLVRLVGRRVGVQTGQQLITSGFCVAVSLAPWLNEDHAEHVKCKSIILDLVCSTLETCANTIHSNLAQKAFEVQFPRFVRRAPLEGPSSLPKDDVQIPLDALAKLSFTASDYFEHLSIGSLILIAHTEQRALGGELFTLLPLFLTSIQTNTALDETLSILLTSLGFLRAEHALDVPPEFTVPLVHVLGPLAGSHPDAPTRHFVFRLLSITLSLAPPAIRLALLQELLSDSEALTPQMQVATIGLVKEAALEALSHPVSDQTPPNPFTSSVLLRDLGPIIFSLQSPDLFLEGNVELPDFIDSPEPLRLVESLTLLYVLLHRDVGNRTGIRDPSNIEAIRQNLLVPLQSQLDFWKQIHNPSDPDDAEHEHEVMQLGIVDMWLERAQAIVREVC